MYRFNTAPVLAERGADEAARAMAEAGPGQDASEERSAPVTCRQEWQWQEEAGRGREEGGRGGVEKVCARQRQRARRVVIMVVGGVGWVCECQMDLDSAEVGMEAEVWGDSGNLGKGVRTPSYK